MKDIKVVSFDFWNTFAQPNPLYAEARTEYLKDNFGISKEDYTKVKSHLDHYAEYYGISMPTISVISLLFPYPNYSDVDIFHVKYQLEELFGKFPPNIPDEVLQSLTVLNNRGIYWGITSNTNFISGEIIDRYINDTIPETLHENCLAMVFSDVVGFSKPSPNIFSSFISQGAYILGIDSIDKSNVLHIGDNINCDYYGARDFEFHAALIKTPQDILNIVKEL